MFARVKYLRDRETCNVPIDFIQNFDPRNFVTTRPYWCFWSSKAKGINTPEDMLKHVREIPTFDENLVPSVEIDQSFEGSGYHKAVVMTVAESAAALEALIKTKRVRGAPQKLISMSFDEALQDCSSKQKKASKASKPGQTCSAEAVKRDRCHATQTAQISNLSLLNLVPPNNENNSADDSDPDDPSLNWEGTLPLSVEINYDSEKDPQVLSYCHSLTPSDLAKEAVKIKQENEDAERKAEGEKHEQNQKVKAKQDNNKAKKENKQETDEVKKKDEKAKQSKENQSREKKAKEEEIKAKAEREKKLKEEKEKKAKEEREKKLKEEKEKKAKEEREKKAKEGEKKAKEHREKKAKEEREKKAREEREMKAKEEREKKAKEEREKKAKEEREKKAKEEREKKAKEERKKKLEEEKISKDNFENEDCERDTSAEEESEDEENSKKGNSRHEESETGNSEDEGSETGKLKYDGITDESEKLSEDNQTDKITSSEDEEIQTGKAENEESKTGRKVEDEVSKKETASIKRKSSRRGYKRKIIDSTDSEDEIIISPTKYRALEMQLRQANALNFKLQNLNQRMQTILLDLLERIGENEPANPSVKSFPVSPRTPSTIPAAPVRPKANESAHGGSVMKEDPKTPSPEVDEEVNNLSDKDDDIFEDNPDEEGFERCPGKILKGKVLRDFWKTKRGPDGDSIFVKNVAHFAFGPVILKTHSVSGRRVNRKRADGTIETIYHPPLDIIRLQGITNFLKERLRREGVADVSKDPRIAQTRINTFITQKIKTLRKNPRV